MTATSKMLTGEAAVAANEIGRHQDEVRAAMDKAAARHKEELKNISEAGRAMHKELWRTLYAHAGIEEPAEEKDAARFSLDLTYFDEHGLAFLTEAEPSPEHLAFIEAREAQEAAEAAEQGGDACQLPN